MSAKTPDCDNSDLVVLDETGSDSSPESDVQIIEDEAPEPKQNSDVNNSSLLHKLKEIQAENESLKEKLNNTLNSNDRLIIGRLEEPVVIVHFMKECQALKFKSQIENYLKNLLLPESDEEITEIKSTDYTFYIDTKAQSSKHKSRKSRTKYPIFTTEVTDVMTDEVEKEEKTQDDKPRNSCFNCCGDHMMNECPKPIDRQQIAINRKGFYNKFGGRQSRYHVDIESQNAKFKPGVLSPDLRRALNIGENQLPLHIYRMRVLGYPPGWLSEAKVESSGITMYDTHGKEVAEIEDVEEGEVSDGSIRIQFDPDKLIEYPGFNIYPQSGIIDDYEKLGFPAMNETQLKSTIVQRMKPPQATPYKRKRDKDPIQPNKKPRIEVDMEIDEENDFDPKNMDFTTDFVDIDWTNNPHHSTTNNSKAPSTTTTENLRRAISPSLEELEKQKNQIMEQLDSSDSSNSANNCTQFTTPRVTRSKSVCYGTPIPETATPFTSLPDATKFSATITEHMNFENLPDSTGSYNKMKELLHKIRRRTL